jgi:anti-sigma factor RsiW
MNMKQEILEILIGKYLDGEITPSEQQILQAELQRDSKAKGLLEQLQDLHERSCQAVTSEIIGRGKDAEEIFERAWRRRKARPLRRILKMDGRLRFAAGLAAGLAIGLLLHFVLPFVSTSQSPDVPTNMLAQNTDTQMDAEQLNYPQTPTEPAGNPLRNVDWYSFTDKQGNQWLIEGLREDTVRPAAYYGDL